jgi:hypothetical protein
MAAGIGHFQLVVLGEFLCRLDGEDQRLAAGIQPAAAAFVKSEFGVDQCTLMAGQPARAVECGRCLLAAGQRHLDASARLEAFFLQPDHRVDPGRDLGLHVGGAAAVEIAILLDQGERIARPVLALGFHHVEMAQQQHGLGLGIAAVQDRHQPALLGMIGDAEGMQVGIGIAGGFQVRRHAFRREGAASRRQAGVGFHQLLVQGAEALLIGTGLGHRWQCQ